jgi:hypothetical protein
MKMPQCLLLICIVLAAPTAILHAQGQQIQQQKPLSVGLELSLYPLDDAGGDAGYIGAAVRYDLPLGLTIAKSPLMLRSIASVGWKYMSLGAAAKIEIQDVCFFTLGLMHDESFKSEPSDISVSRSKIFQNISYMLGFGIETRNMWLEIQWHNQFQATKYTDQSVSGGKVYYESHFHMNEMLSCSLGVRLGW